MATIKNAILKTKIENEIVEVMIKTNSQNVYVDETTTLAAKLAEIATEVDNKATPQDISDAINALVDGAPGTMDTLKEISDYLATHGEEYEALVSLVGKKVDKVEGYGLSKNDFTDILKAKLDGIAEGAEVNQNAFSSIKVGEVTVNATTKTDSLEVVAGNNVNVNLDSETKKLTISAVIPEISEATTSKAGLMSADDKTKLDGIEEGANKTIVDDALNGTSTNPPQTKVVDAAIKSKSDIYYQSAQPASLKANDIWFQILE